MSQASASDGSILTSRCVNLALLVVCLHLSVSNLCIPSEADNDLDAPIELGVECNLLRGVDELGRERLLRDVFLADLYQFQRGATLRYNLLECLPEALVEALEGLLESFLLVLVDFLEQARDAVHGLVAVLGFALQLKVLLMVLFEPLLTVPVLPWELVQLLGGLVD